MVEQQGLFGLQVSGTWNTLESTSAVHENGRGLSSDSGGSIQGRNVGRKLEGGENRAHFVCGESLAQIFGTKVSQNSGKLDFCFLPEQEDYARPEPEPPPTTFISLKRYLDRKSRFWRNYLRMFHERFYDEISQLSTGLPDLEIRRKNRHYS